MTTNEQNGYLILEHLSDIELYYNPSGMIKNGEIILDGEEFHHAVNVMRNSSGDILFITDGLGKLFKTKITQVKKSLLTCIIEEKTDYQNPAKNIWFCIPVLKNPDRLKFALEKCVELGITNFILFTSKYSVSKKINIDKYQKTLLSAMKQSLRTFLPGISSANFNEIINFQGRIILFDQKSQLEFDCKLKEENKTYFLFGPEGGFDNSEINSVSHESVFNLSSSRLRSETAIIKCASILSFI